MADEKKAVEDLELDLEEFEDVLELTDVVEIGEKYRKEEPEIAQQALFETSDAQKEPEVDLAIETESGPKAEALGKGGEEGFQIELTEVQEKAEPAPEIEEFGEPKDKPLFEEAPLVTPLEASLKPQEAVQAIPIDQKVLEEMIRDTVEKAVEKAVREAMLEVAERLIGEAIEGLRKAIGEAG